MKNLERKGSGLPQVAPAGAVGNRRVCHLARSRSLQRTQGEEEGQHTGGGALQVTLRAKGSHLSHSIPAKLN